MMSLYCDMIETRTLIHGTLTETGDWSICSGMIISRRVTGFFLEDYQ
jgi:hypothetical protein